MLYVITGIMVIFTAVSVILTMMALLNFMWLYAGISAVTSIALLYGMDYLAEVIEGA